MIDILILTYNRPLYLKRSIDYWSRSKFNIIIADGSKNFFKYPFPRNFKYFHLPDTTMLYRVLFLSKKSKQDYLVFCADDDFHSFDALKNICTFLKKNKDYACAQGMYLRVGQKTNQKSLLFGATYLNSISEDTKKLNLEKKDLLTNFVNMNYPICYAVMRNSVMKDFIKFFDGLDLKNSLQGKVSFQLIEDLTYYAVFLNGHYITLPLFYSLRQNQIQSYESWYNDELFLNDFFADWVNNNGSEWQLVKKNIKTLIKEKFNFTFNFNKDDILYKYALNAKNIKIKKNQNTKEYNYFRRKLNHLKISLFILIRTRFRIKNFISYYKSLKLMKSIIKNNEVEK